MAENNCAEVNTAHYQREVQSVGLFFLFLLSINPSSIIHGSRGSLCRPLGSHLDRIPSAGRGGTIAGPCHSPSIHQSLSIHPINQSIHPSTPIDPAYRKEDLSSLVPWVGLLALTGPSGLAWMLNGMDGVHRPLQTGSSSPAAFSLSPSFVPHIVESQPVTSLLSGLLGSIDRGSAMKVLAKRPAAGRPSGWKDE